MVYVVGFSTSFAVPLHGPCDDVKVGRNLVLSDEEAAAESEGFAIAICPSLNRP